MAQVLDEFVINYTLQRMQGQHEALDKHTKEYEEKTDDSILRVSNRVGDLEQNGVDYSSDIKDLYKAIQLMQKDLRETKTELNKTKLINLKQEIIIRTLNNLKYFEAHDMFTDTFADGSGVDWENSLRAELLNGQQAVGVTQKSIISAQQTSQKSTLLISKNGSSDEALAQSFVVDKTRKLDKLGLWLEPFSVETFRPIHIGITDVLGGSWLHSVTLEVDQVASDWMEIDFPELLLEGGKDYYIVIRTDDIYGYKVGIDPVDKYIAGSSYSYYKNVWTDNNHDLSFKVWCFLADDENDAIILTYPKTLPTLPEMIVFEKEDTLFDGTANYYISRDGGAHWKILHPGIETDLNDLPAGKTVILKAVVTSTARIEAWGYVIKRSEA